MCNRYNCRLNEVSVSLNNISSAQDLSALLFYGVKSLLILLDSHLCVQWTEKDSLAHRLSNFNSLVCGDHSLDEAIVNTLVQEYATHRCASLTRSAYTGKHAGFQCEIQVSIIHNNCSIISTKLKDCSPESLADILSDALSDGCGSCEGNQRQSLIIHKHTTNISST